MKGLNLFKSKDKKEITNYESFKGVFDIDKTPFYKLFISLYHLGADYNNYAPVYKTEKNDILVNFGNLKIDSPCLPFDCFFQELFNIGELIADLKDYSFEEVPYLERGLIRIGSIGIGGGIFLGTKGDDIDKVYIVIWDSNEVYHLVADNIFEFAQSIYFEPETDNLPNGISHSDLYKNWGEDFYRIKR